ncbi:MAG TPA: ribosome small subunit-dependent GTPase A [Gammaproteobacteria bacterium]|nr:ribosome small subunit-dependent GTPase A [Gammaproteobacteria bacterium]
MSSTGVNRQTARAGDPCREGLVVARHGARVTVEDDKGRLHECMSRRRLGTVVCGDRVRWRPARNGHCTLESLQPRRSLLVRPDARGRLRPVCANVDQLVVVNAPLQASVRPPLRLELLDRYLAAAELMEVRALIVVNKIDLIDEAGRGVLEEALAHYEATGYPVLLTSTVSGAGMAMLKARLAGHTSVLVGESGVGKSSLIQHLLPDLEIRIGEISAASGLGRHTTTTTTLYHLPDGGDLIDSPGVRDFGLWPVEAAALARGFRDFGPWLGQCRFRNCRHEGEAGCALDAAVAEGHLPARRLESYRAILRDLEARRR